MILGEIVVLIPITMGHLDEAHPAFAKPPGQQTLPRERSGPGVVQSVETPGGSRFAVETHDLGRLGLHAKGEFEGFDARLQGGIAAGGGEVIPIEFAQEIELGALQDRVLVRIVQVVDRRLLHRHAPADGRSLMDGGQEGTRPVAHAAVAEGGIDRKEARQILILSAQTVGNPRTHAGPDEGVGTRMQFQQSPAVRLVGPVNGLQEAQVIGTGTDVGKQVADHGAGFPVRPEFPG